MNQLEHIEKSPQVSLAFFLDLRARDVSIERPADKPVSSAGIRLLDDAPFLEADQAVLRSPVSSIASGQLRPECVGVDRAVGAVGHLQRRQLQQVSRWIHPVDEVLLDPQVVLDAEEDAAAAAEAEEAAGP